MPKKIKYAPINVTRNGVEYMREDESLVEAKKEYHRGLGDGFANGMKSVQNIQNEKADAEDEKLNRHEWERAEGIRVPKSITPEGRLFEKVLGTTTNKRAEILRTAEELINGDRAQTYGAPEISFGRIADLWNAMGLGVLDLMATVGERDLYRPVTAVDVALALIQLKVSRVISSTDHEDSWIDIAGYAGLGGEMATKEKN